MSRSAKHDLWGRHGLVSWLGVGLTVAVFLVLGSLGRGQSPTLSSRVDSLASQIRCPSCSALSVEQSTAPTAVAVKNAIRQRMAAGESNGEIETYLVSRYGVSILLSPPAKGFSALVWVVPLAVVAAAVAVFLAVMVHRRMSEGEPGSGSPSEEDTDLVEAELAHLEAR